MSMNDTLSDMITRLRNGQRASLHQIRVPASRLIQAVLNVLKEEGYIQDYVSETISPGRSELVVTLKYYEGEAVIKEIKRVSKPGRRVYESIANLPLVRNGLGIAVLSTSKGVLSDNEARRVKQGGEILCEVY